MPNNRIQDYKKAYDDQSSNGNTIFVGRGKNCLAGFAIALPFSIFLWVGIITLKYSALRIIS